MTQRSILAGPAPTVIVKVGSDVAVRAVEGERVTAESRDLFGLQVERKKDAIEVKFGGSGEVLVPLHSNVKVYSGRSLEVEGVQGEASAYAGLNLALRQVARVAHASAGGKMDIDCDEVVGNELKFSAGRDIRLQVRRLASATFRVNDLGGYWEGRVGDGQVRVIIKAGGDVTLVTDREIQPLPPDFILGIIEKPH